jgi:hypothetical protein
MEIRFDITRKFQKEFDKLSADNKKRASSSIDKLTPSFNIEKGDPSGKIYQLKHLPLPKGLDSSLYVLKATKKLRIILTIEDDPIFSEKVITLFRIIGTDELNKAHKSIFESLYQSSKFDTSLEGDE